MANEEATEVRARVQELGNRYVDLVYGAAVRQMGGEGRGAEDVTQAVFLVALRKAKTGGLPEEGRMAGWLLKVTGFAVMKARRAAQRRKRHEEGAAAGRGEAVETETDMPEVRRVLDQALLKLGAMDREVVVRRHLRGEPVGEVAMAVGLTENTTSQRIGRALEKLRKILGRSGVVVPVAALAGMMMAEGAKAAPLGVAAGATVGSNAAAVGIAKGAAAMMKLAMLKMTAAITLATVVILGAGAYVGLVVMGGEPTPIPASAAATAPATRGGELQSAMQGAKLAMLHGRVVEGKPEVGVAGAELSGYAVKVDSLAHRGTSDTLGNFAILGAASDMYVHAISSDQTLGAIVLVKSGDDNLTIAVGPTAQIHGRLLDKADKPWANQVIHYGYDIPMQSSPDQTAPVRAVITAFGGRITTGDDGSFTVKGLVSGHEYNFSLFIDTDYGGKIIHILSRVTPDSGKPIELGDVTDTTAPLPARRPAAKAAPAAGVKVNLPFKIGSDTTGIVAPLKGDGTVDYVKAWNERYGKGVTTAENGFAFWYDMVDDINGAAINDAARQILGLKTPEQGASGPRFQTLTQYLKGKGRSRQSSVVERQLMAAAGLGCRAWKAEDFPDVAEYLKTYDAAMDRGEAAVSYRHWFMPLVSDETGQVHVSGFFHLKDYGWALCARATLRREAGDIAGFMKDVTTARRLARLESEGGAVLHWGNGSFEERLVIRTIGIAAGAGHLTADEQKQLAAMLAAEGSIKTLDVDVSWRWHILDVAQRVATGVMEPDELGRDCASMDRAAVDWDEVMQMIQSEMDGVVTALKSPNMKETGLKERVAKLREESGGDSKRIAGEDRWTYSERVVKLLMASQIQGVMEVDREQREIAMEEEMLGVVMAAARYRAEKGTWAKEWTALVPEYLKAMPKDIYSEGGSKEVGYMVSDQGVRVFSFGPNGKDDGGVFDPSKGMDDIVVGILDSK